MSLRRHIVLLLQAIGVWGAFWVAGLPDYYQQYATVTMSIACILLSVLISLCTIAVLGRVRESARMSFAFWLSMYYTVPFAVLDLLYCGWHLGHGAGFLERYWYLSVFYLTPWLTFMPTVLLLRRVEKRLATEGH